MSDQEKEEQSKRSGKYQGMYKEEYLDDVLDEYGLIQDQDMEKSILAIMNHLLGPEANTRICLCENIIPLAMTLTGPNQTMICVNPNESKALLQNEEGKYIVYATLAHEIGHIHFAKKTNFHYEDTVAWTLETEVRADEIALDLMQKIFKNPREILLRQIDRALGKMFKIKTTQEKIDLAVAIHEARKKALIGD
jgi:hypothetical protein